MKLDLQSIRDLQAEAKNAGLRPDHHNIGALKLYVTSQEARFKRLKNFIDEVMSKDDKLTDSQFIDPFLRAAFRIIEEGTFDEQTVANSSTGS